MEGNLFTLFATLVNFLILMLFLKHYLFDKVNKVIDNRNNEVIDTVQYAENRVLEADKLKESYDIQIANLENKGREIVREAKVKADAQAKGILQEAEQRTATLLRQTEDEIERLKKKSIEDMKKEIGALAIFAAEKILEKELDHQEQQAVIGRIIDETGNSKWQN
ncbi:MAG: F0F1 ATP synthase subunit B [Eubacteriales bacterium]|nr:F0F1 ATP synthase subunit B [Eubacteriales bacterium]MDD3199150.1 F0F1 ATP synthase subunit B [Eubacteriales bacterium]MDD4121539.1 F0F1 ATP synthase subunit B [Eubacteriales bacterium]MDD4629195.1 F0F1 ATP synthase subunit B [Eubacteriales bacterium]